MYKLHGVFLLPVLCWFVSSWGMDSSSRSLSRPDKRLLSSDGQLQKIFQAIETYHNDAITVLVEKKPSLINVYAYHKELRCKVAPLHVAVKFNNILAVELLLRLKANPNAPITSEEGNMPLHITQSVEVAELLVERGAWVNVRNSFGKTPLMKMYAGKHSPFFSIAGCLLGRGADGNVQFTDGSEFLLHKLVRRQKKYAIQQLLEHGVNAECYNNKGQTPLDLALDAFESTESKSDIMDKKTSLDYFKRGNVLFYPATLEPYQCPYRLLKNRAVGFIKLKGDDEKARQAENILTELFIVLHRVKQHKSCQAIVTSKKGYLFNRASLTDLENWVGEDAVDCIKRHIDGRAGLIFTESFFKKNKTYYIVQKKMMEQYPFLLKCTINDLNFFLLYALIFCGNTSDIQWLLSNFECNLQGEDEDGDTLLHNVMINYNSKPEIIELLMEHGVDYTAVNRKGLTAYRLARIKQLVLHEKAFIKGVFKGIATMPCSQLKQLIDMRVSPNVRHPETEVPLLLAAAYTGSFEKCYFLVQFGADVNIYGINHEDNKNYSPLLWVVQQGNNNLIALFLKYGAVVTQEMLECVHAQGIRELLKNAYNKQKNI